MTLDTLTIDDRHGHAIVTLRAREINGNPALSALAGRIQRIKKQDSTPVQKNVARSVTLLFGEVNRAIKPNPATMDELLAALESRIIVDAVAHRVREMRDPEYFGDMAHGE